jgi:hypothetical protein
VAHDEHGIVGRNRAPVVLERHQVERRQAAVGGDTADEVLGQSPRLLQGADTDTAVLERLNADMAASLVFEGKATNHRKDGTPFTIWWRVIPVMDSAGKPACYAAFQHKAHPA